MSYKITGGTFSGDGFVTGLLYNHGGTVHPGMANTPGMLTVVGDYTQDRGTLKIDIDASGDIGLLKVYESGDGNDGVCTVGASLIVNRDPNYKPVQGTELQFINVTPGGSHLLNQFATTNLANDSWSAGGVNNLSFDPLDDPGNGYYALEVTAPVSTTAIVSASSNPSPFGQAVTFTAVVSANQGFISPTGTVTFLDGTRTLGTGFLNSSGDATFTTSSLSIGSHSITAVYGENIDYADGVDFEASTSGALTQVVTLIPTAVSLSADNTSIVVGQTVTLSAIRGMIECCG